MLFKKALAMEEHVLVEHKGQSGDRSPPYNDKFCSEFAGILQVEIRQLMSDIRMLIPISYERSMQ